MSTKDALKLLRRELNITQTELANAVNASYCSVNRWENGHIMPLPATAAQIIIYAEKMKASDECMNGLRNAFNMTREAKLRLPSSKLYTVEKESLCRLVDDSVVGVYVCDYETDELLYCNKRVEEFFKKRISAGKTPKCYEFIANRTSPCPNCAKSHMSTTGYTDTFKWLGDSQRYYHIRGKRTDWHGRSAHVQYLTDVTDSIEAQDGLKKLLDNVNVGICTGNIYDDWRMEVTFLNGGYYKMIGADRSEREQFTGFSSLLGITPEERAQTMHKILRASKNREDFTVDFHICVCDGEPIMLHLCGTFTERCEDHCVYTCVIFKK